MLDTTSEQFDARLSRTIRSIADQGIQKIELKLTPEHLGNVVVEPVSYTHLTEGRSYYRSSSPYLRRVTFVADRDFSGTAEIDFNAWDTKGNRFAGTVEVAVGRGGKGDIRYSVHRNGKVTLDDNDFNALCRDCLLYTSRCV